MPVGAGETTAAKTTALQGGRAKDALFAVADGDTPFWQATRSPSTRITVSQNCPPQFKAHDRLCRSSQQPQHPIDRIGNRNLDRVDHQRCCFRNFIDRPNTSKVSNFALSCPLVRAQRGAGLTHVQRRCNMNLKARVVADYLARHRLASTRAIPQPQRSLPFLRHVLGVCRSSAY